MGKEQKLVFGEIPPEEATFRRRSEAARRKPLPNQEVYGVYRVSPLIEEVLKADWEKWQTQTVQRRQQQQEIFKAVWGEKVEIPWYISPSIACNCLRWVGFEALGYKPAPPTTEASLVMMVGSAAHWSLLRKIEQQIPGLQETSFTIDEADLSGRADYLFKNPSIGEYQILELKFVHDYVFRQIKREGLPDYLRSTKGIYQPQPEQRHQVLLYIWGKRKQGLDVTCANIIYVNRNDGTRKEALVIWDAVAEYDAEQLVQKIKGAKIQIDKKEFPTPTVESPYICAKFCPHRLHCEHGQRFAAGQIKIEKKRRPQFVYRQLRQQAEATKARMERLGLVQAELPGFGDVPGR